MVANEFIDLPIDDEGHMASVRVSHIHAIADTMDAALASVLRAVSL